MCKFIHVYDILPISLINAYHLVCALDYVAYGFIEYEDRRDAEVTHFYPVHVFSLVLCIPFLCSHGRVCQMYVCIRLTASHTQCFLSAKHPDTSPYLLPSTHSPPLP